MSSGGLRREESEEGNQREYIIGDSKYSKWEVEAGAEDVVNEGVRGKAAHHAH